VNVEKSVKSNFNKCKQTRPS